MREGADHRVPVLIADDSLMGLSMPLFPGRHGVRHTLAERHAAPSVHPRGRGNYARTMELFRVPSIDEDGVATDGRTASCGSVPARRRRRVAVQAHRSGRCARGVQSRLLASVQPERPRIRPAARRPGTRRRPQVLPPHGVLRTGPRRSDHGRARPEQPTAPHGPRGLPRRGRRAAQSGPNCRPTRSVFHAGDCAHEMPSHLGRRLEHRYPGRARPGVEASRRARRLGTDKGCWRATRPSAGPVHRYPRLRPLRGTQPPGPLPGHRRRTRRHPERHARRRPWPPLPLRGAVMGADPDQPVVPARMRLIGGPGSRAPHLWLRRAGARLSTLDLHERSMVQTLR